MVNTREKSSGETRLFRGGLYRSPLFEVVEAAATRRWPEAGRWGWLNGRLPWKKGDTGSGWTHTLRWMTRGDDSPVAYRLHYRKTTWTNLTNNWDIHSPMISMEKRNLYLIGQCNVITFNLHLANTDWCGNGWIWYIVEYYMIVEFISFTETLLFI